MKHKTVSTIAAILCLGLTTGLLCSSCKTGTVLLMNTDDNLRISSSGFDIRGTVTDEDGNPLDGVTMEMAFSRVNTASFRSENLNETETVDSAFHVQRKGWTELQLTFWKDGYFPERLAFDSPWLEKGKKRYVEEDGVQVRMVKMGPIAKLYRTRTSDSIRLKYDFKQESGAICDLSMLQASEELDRRLSFLYSLISGREHGSAALPAVTVTYFEPCTDECSEWFGTGGTYARIEGTVTRINPEHSRCIVIRSSGGDRILPLEDVTSIDISGDSLTE